MPAGSPKNSSTSESSRCDAASAAGRPSSSRDRSGRCAAGRPARHDAAVGLGAQQPAEALLERQRGGGQRVVGERTSRPRARCARSAPRRAARWARRTAAGRSPRRSTTRRGRRRPARSSRSRTAPSRRRSRKRSSSRSRGASPWRSTVTASGPGRASACTCSSARRLVKRQQRAPAARAHERDHMACDRPRPSPAARGSGASRGT